MNHPVNEKENRLLRLFGNIREEYIEEAAPGKKRTSRRLFWPGAAAAVLALVLLCTAVLKPGGTPFAAMAAKAYEPNYSQKYGGAPLGEEYLADIRSFSVTAGQAILDSQDTTAYSPVTLYMALSMVSELADGSSREALLQLLQAEDNRELRAYGADLWRYLCNHPRQKEPGKVTLANSLWLNENYNFHGDVLQDLADHYYVASYTGDMGNDIPGLVSRWVQEQTHGLLDCQLNPTPDTMAALLSAVYFYDDWAQPFAEEDILAGSFHVSEEKRVSCNYLSRKESAKEYYQGQGVTASVQTFQNGGKMLFILPDEQSSPQAVLENTELLSSLLNWESLEKNAGTVDWLIPRFTMSKTINLQDSLTQLGLGQFFDSGANPLPRLSDTPAYISRAEQGTAISIDEKGCEAASYVLIEMSEGAAEIEPEPSIPLHLNRPFLFAILSENDVPLFLGVINDPGNAPQE